MKWLKVFFSHAIFISCCAAALCFQSISLLNLHTGNFVYALLFAGTLAGYNFYAVVAMLRRGDSFSLLRKNKLLVFHVLFLVVSAVVLLLVLMRHPNAIVPVFASSALTVLYSFPLWFTKQPSWLRSIGFLKTLLLSFTWAFSTVIIPAAVVGSAFSNETLLLFTARFFFMLMLSIIFDSRDAAADKEQSFHSLATNLSASAIHRLMIMTFIAYIIAGLLFSFHFGNEKQAIAFVLNGVMVLIVFRLSLRQSGYYFYYFIVDGLMLLSTLSHYLVTI